MEVWFLSEIKDSKSKYKQTWSFDFVRWRNWFYTERWAL